VTLLVGSAVVTALAALTSSLITVTRGAGQLGLIVGNSLLLLMITLLSARKTDREARRGDRAERLRAEAGRHKAEAERLRDLAEQLRAEADDRRRQAERGEEIARAEMRVVLHSALAPVVRHMGDLATEPDPRTYGLRCRETAVWVLNAALVLGPGPQRVRVCWYRLQAGVRQRLVVVQHVGRQTSPPPTFDAGTTAGDTMLEMIRRDASKFVVDIRTEPLPGWPQLERPDFRTFMAVPVVAGNLAFGMLTADAPGPGDLTKEDLGLLDLLAGILATALAHEAREKSAGALTS
jgi:GAF domain-containing protein